MNSQRNSSINKQRNRRVFMNLTQLLVIIRTGNQLCEIKTYASLLLYFLLITTTLYGISMNNLLLKLALFLSSIIISSLIGFTFYLFSCLNEQITTLQALLVSGATRSLSSREGNQRTSWKQHERWKSLNAIILKSMLVVIRIF